MALGVTSGGLGIDTLIDGVGNDTHVIDSYRYLQLSLVPEGIS